MVSISEIEHLNLDSRIQYLEGITLNYLNSTNASLLMIKKEEINEFRCIRIPSELVYEVCKAIYFIIGDEDEIKWTCIRANICGHFPRKFAKLHENYIMTEDVKEKVYPILYESGLNISILISDSLIIYKLYLWVDNFYKFTESKQSLERLKMQLSEIERNR